MNNTPKVSIIVPVYKAEKYIHRCLDSIQHQTFTDWECILVDDGSPDTSGAICDEYAAKDGRFKVIHKVNGGVSSARNMGIENAKGEWVAFVDSDDWLYDCYLSNFAESDSKEIDHILQSFSKEGHNSQIIVRLQDQTFTHPAKLIAYLESAKDVHNGFIWHRLYRNSIIQQNHLRFLEDMSYAEDGLFNLQFLRYAKNIKTLPTVGYHYRLGNGGLTSVGKTLKDINVAVDRLDRYSCEMNSITSDCNDSNHVSGCIRFLWRVAISWILRKSVSKYDDYKIAHKSLNIWAEKFDIVNQYRMSSYPMSRILLLWITHSNVNKVNYMVTKCLISLCVYENRIKNKI